MENITENKICLVCFDEFTEGNPSCINPIDCPCKFDIHEECWMSWINFKRTIIECPICHKNIADEEDVGNHEDDEEDIQDNNQLVNEVNIINMHVENSIGTRFIMFICKIFVIIYLILYFLWVNF
jgi:hypothetical protein